MVAKTTSKNIHQRFWCMVNRGGPDDCWLWKGGTTGGDPKRGKSHGRFALFGKPKMAHHVSWILAGNEIPKGKLLLHKCDNPLCVNPKHLYVGNHQANKDDMVRRGRAKFASPGESNPEAKVTEQQVVEILDLYYRDGFSQQAIANHYKLHQGHVSRIILRKCWIHVPYRMPVKRAVRRRGQLIPVNP